MKKIKTLILLIAIFCTNHSIVVAQDCSKLNKLSKEYAECNASLLKKKINKLNIKDKLLKFKNSKSHKDFIKN
tara:strand:+ start:57 stop:275 length:219 start_codon:yes stop_codon:yes gene_type:complete